MDNHEKPRNLRLEPAVSEEWVRRVVKHDASPNEFAEWLLATADLDTRIAQYLAHVRGRDPEQREPAQADVGSQPAGLSTPVRRGFRVDEARWTKERFFDFLEVVSSIEDLEWSLALLNAYLHLGPIPKGEELKNLCQFKDDSIWHQELRVAKQKLTLQARRMNAPGLFPRAKTGAGGQRLHPIEPVLFPWLREWEEHRSSEQGSIEGKLTEPEHWGPAREKDKAKEATT